MNNIRYLDLTFSLFGRNIRTRHLTELRKSEYEPIGRQLVFKADNFTDTIYVDLPMLTFDSITNILDTTDTDKIKNILNEIARILSDNGFVMYPGSGMDVTILEESPVIKFGSQFITLIDGKAPNQSDYRALIDISDQLQNYSPLIDCKLVFMTESNENTFVSKLPFELYMKYGDDNKIYFYSNLIVMSYDLLTGMIAHAVGKDLENKLIESHRKNFPTDKNPITINLLAIEAMVNYRSIIFN